MGNLQEQPLMPALTRNDPWKTDAAVCRWKANLAHGSRKTATTYYGSLSLFLTHAKLDPHAFIALPGRERDDVVADYVAALAKRKLSSATMKTAKASIASWMDWNSLQFGRRIKVPSSQTRPRASKYHITDNTGLAKALNAADTDERLAISLMAFSGFRPEVLGSDTDGLRLEDLKDARLTPEGVVFDQIPCRIEVPEHLSKTNAYSTFLGPEGCEYLQASIRQRVLAGEKLTPESPVVRSKRPGKPFLTSGSISAMIRKPMRRAGLQEPPYIWRSYFSNRCMMAQSKGLHFEWKEFFMGHKSTVASLYSIHKVLPPDTVEEMRRGYALALKYLETKTPMQVEDPTLEWVSVLMQTAGYDPQDVSPAALSGKSHQEIVEMLKTAFKKATQGPGSLQQRIVNLGELDGLLATGWSFRAALPDGRAIIEGPGT